MLTVANLLLAVAALPAVFFLLCRYKDYQYERKSAKHGCGKVPYLRNEPFGFKLATSGMQAFKENRVVWTMVGFFKRARARTARIQTPGGGFSIVTQDPENIKAVLATQFKEYDLQFRYKVFQPLLGDGIFTLSGNGWHHTRAMLRPQFTTEQVSRLNDLEHHSQVLIERFREKSHTGVPFDVQEFFFNLTLDTATEFLFGQSTNCNSFQGEKAKNDIDTALRPSSEDFMNYFNIGQKWLLYRSIGDRLYYLVTGKDFKDSIKVCHSFVDYYVNKSLKLAEEQDAHEKENQGRYIFLNELTKETRDPILMRDQAMNILIAGRDTTASLLSFIIAFLVRRKDVFEKLRTEILNDFGTGTEKITFQSLKRCEYLKNVINETLRVCPIVPRSARQSNCDTTLPRGGGPDESEPVFVPKGTSVAYSIFALQHDKELWGEDADEFRPERWETQRAQPWTYVPFSGGPRICLGQQFALTEAAYVIVRLCQTFSDITTTPENLEDFKHYVALTSCVAGGVNVVFKE
ncbi:hypothetical protein TRICI_002580 [Trichomonascus ciferrii]|uniref:Cytochrome P450 n=1 Tax=Trichomonascus ciferrii TaxID=44093 RepID=A0A642VB91_9ASCO|nr:hypothetical protein TRICI_002580 [Trichomonascus ciferrii]